MLNIFKRKEESGQKAKSAGKLVCNYCSTEFSDKEHLEKHKKVAHPKGR
jgi:hypothetical protein